MARLDAGDLSIVIPYRADGPERRENLAAALLHLARTCDGLEILVLEDAPAPNPALLPDIPGLRHVALPNDGPFHRTRLLNLGIAGLATRRFCASYDADALIYPGALLGALELLRRGAGLVLPFDGRFIDLRGTARIRAVQDGALPSVEGLPRRRLRWWQPAGDIVCVNEASVGGVVMFDRAAFTRCGGYHEGFRAWGFEDAEIARRVETLGVGVARVPGWPLLHLAHPRRRRDGAWYRGAGANRALYRKMSALGRAEIEAMIADGALRDPGSDTAVWPVPNLRPR